MGKPLIDMTGRKIGRLTVKCRAEHKGKRTGAFWKCECECGNEVVVYGSELRKGETKSCGCLHKEELSKRARTHGLSGKRIYRIWQTMIKRCHKPNFERYKDYGGRGIEVCPEWKNSFEKFHEWAMANGYKENLTIDRIDTNGNYEPSNCRWVTYKVQGNNTRRNHYIEYNGERHTMAEWAEIKGMKLQTLAARINIYKWPIEKALTTPVKK